MSLVNRISNLATRIGQEVSSIWSAISGKASLSGADFTGNVNIRGEFFADSTAFGGFPLAPNLIHNSYMNKVSGTVPDGFTCSADISIEAVSPFAKAFEGRYVSTAYYDANPSEFTSDPESANDSGTLTYWFGNYTKGPRIKRGGMGDGWHAQNDGKILKITGSGLTDTNAQHCAVFPPKEENQLGAKWLFSAFVKIVKGDSFRAGTDAGYKLGHGTTLISKEQCDSGSQGWTRIVGVITTSQITKLDALAFSLAIIPDGNGDIEGYIALPYLANLTFKGENIDSWTNSLIDKFARQGFSIHPGTKEIEADSSVMKLGGNQVWHEGNFTPGEKMNVSSTRWIGIGTAANPDCWLEISDSNPVIFGHTFGAVLTSFGDAVSNNMLAYFGGIYAAYGISVGGNDVYHTGNFTKSVIESLLSGTITSHNHNGAYLPYSTDGTYPYIASGNWIRTSSAKGILPYAAGTCYIGTSSWKFSEIHALTFYENGVSLANKYAGKNDTMTPSDDTVTTAKLAAQYKTRISMAALDVDFASGQVFAKTLTTNSTLTFSNLHIGVKDLEISGDFALALPVWLKIISGEYDGTVANLIQIVVTNDGSGSESGWCTISQEAAS